MQITGLSKKDDDILTNPRRSTINHAIAIATKSPEHYMAVIEYFKKKRDGCRNGTIEHEIYSDYVSALENQL